MDAGRCWWYIVQSSNQWVYLTLEGGALAAEHRFRAPLFVYCD